MTEPNLKHFFGGWEDYQRLLASAIAPLTDQQLGLRAAPHLWSVRMLASHVVAARAWWFQANMGEGGPEIARLIEFDEGERAERNTAAEIVAELDRTWSVIDGCITRWTVADLDHRFQRPTPNREDERPWHDRRYIVWHVAEHDLHHGGEISFSLGMHGIPGIDL